MVKQKDFHFPSPADGISLEGTYLYPDAPKGVVQFLHGMAEHKGRYTGVMTALAEAGYATVIHNHRGHGSCPLTGHFGAAGAEGLITDAREVSRLARDKFPGLPLYLFGHSMGSLIARCYLKRYDDALDGLFLCGTPYAAPAAIAAGRAFIALKIRIHGDRYRSTTVNRLVTGAFNRAIPHPASPHQWISCNEENVAAYDADPLCGFCFTLNGFRALMALMQEAYSRRGWALRHPALPVHLLSGTEDPCHGGLKNFQKTVDLIRGKGYPTTAILFPGMRHEILLEKESPQVFAHIINVLGEMEEP